MEVLKNRLKSRGIKGRKKSDGHIKRNENFKKKRNTVRIIAWILSVHLLYLKSTATFFPRCHPFHHRHLTHCTPVSTFPSSYSPTHCMLPVLNGRKNGLEVFINSIEPVFCMIKI